MCLGLNWVRRRWAMGVLMWEVTSMGQEPYSNVTHLEDMHETLTRGTRLDQPVWAADDV